MVDLISNLINCWFELQNGITILDVICLLMIGISNTMKCLAIYFSFPFGHDLYLKLYGKIHSFVYQRMENLHQKNHHYVALLVDDGERDNF